MAHLEEMKMSMREFPNKPKKWHEKRAKRMNKIITIAQWNRYKKANKDVFKRKTGTFISEAGAWS